VTADRDLDSTFRREAHDDARASCRSYSAALAAAPILTKSFTAAVIFGASDVVAQQIDRAASFDWRRVGGSVLVGCCFFGPAAHAWYAAMQSHFPGTGCAAVATKMLLGQVLFGPALTSVFFAAGLVAADGDGLQALGQLPAKLSRDLLPTMLTGIVFWPLVDLASYTVIARRRGGDDWIPLFANACSFVWQVYLSMMARPSRRGAAGVRRAAQLLSAAA